MRGEFVLDYFSYLSDKGKRFTTVSGPGLTCEYYNKFTPPHKGQQHGTQSQEVTLGIRNVGEREETACV